MVKLHLESLCGLLTCRSLSGPPAMCLASPVRVHTSGLCFSCFWPPLAVKAALLSWRKTLELTPKIAGLSDKVAFSHMSILGFWLESTILRKPSIPKEAGQLAGRIRSVAFCVHILLTMVV